jgi:hypothetical protein
MYVRPDIPAVIEQVIAYRPLRNLLDLLPHELFQSVGRFGIGRGFVVVSPTIVEYELGVLDEVFRVRVGILLVLLLHRCQVHGLLDDIVVVCNLILIDRLLERPSISVVLHGIEKMEKRVVVGTVSRRPSQLIHIWRPPGSLDSWNGQWVDLARAILPLLGWHVDIIALRNSLDLGFHRLLLLEKHLARLEIPDLWDHATLHDGTSLVILDVPHPERPVQRNLLGEALLLEVSNGIVISVGQKMHHRRSGLDVVLQVSHQMCTVTLDLLFGGDGAEDDFGEFAIGERSVRNSSANC